MKKLTILVLFILSFRLSAQIYQIDPYRIVPLDISLNRELISKNKVKTITLYQYIQKKNGKFKKKYEFVSRNGFAKNSLPTSYRSESGYHRRWKSISAILISYNENLKIKKIAQIEYHTNPQAPDTAKTEISYFYSQNRLTKQINSTIIANPKGFTYKGTEFGNDTTIMTYKFFYNDTGGINSYSESAYFCYNDTLNDTTAHFLQMNCSFNEFLDKYYHIGRVKNDSLDRIISKISYYYSEKLLREYNPIEENPEIELTYYYNTVGNIERIAYHFKDGTYISQTIYTYYENGLPKSHHLEGSKYVYKFEYEFYE